MLCGLAGAALAPPLLGEAPAGGVDPTDDQTLGGKDLGGAAALCVSGRLRHVDAAG